jgi:hypothetical protein
MTSRTPVARPLRAVLDALEGGAASTGAIAATTGLDRAVVSTAIEQLERLGRVSVERLSFGCPSGSCFGCALRGPGEDGCGAPAGTARTSPSLLTVRVR